MINPTPAGLLETLRRLTPPTEQARLPRRYWVAYSGGLDSHVLLHALAGLRAAIAPIEVHAVHVNHGLSPNAERWSRHCVEVCAGLGLPCRVVAVEARAARGESPEAKARHARYAALAGLMAPGDCLLAAQHQDDQAETLLLQLLRGAGPSGLAGMPACAGLGAGWLLRPLLAYPRAELRNYAQARGLVWIEDESNFDTGLDRNYLRHQVLPVLRRRWPAFAATLARTATHQAEAARLLGQLAARDLAVAGGQNAASLDVGALAGLDPARQRNAIRRWLQARGLSVPNTRHLERVLADVLAAPPEREPCVRWPGCEVRRYRDRLFATAPLPAHDPGARFAWDTRDALALPGCIGTLSLAACEGAGMAPAACASAPVTVRFRCGGETCRPAARGHHHTLKKLFQEAGIPPWLRDRIPLIYVGEQLAAVADLWVCDSFPARPGEPGLVVVWQRGPDLNGAVADARC